VRNTGRAIIISIAISAVLYIALAVMVAGNLTLTEIIDAENFALAEAARPAFGNAGVWFTVVLAVVATASGVMASVFAASRMLAMLTRMKEVPHRHFRMPGTLRTHAMVYTVAFAIVLTILFDLRRIAALGAIFYLIMDIAIHWGILRHLRSRIDVRPTIVVTAIVLDVIVLAAFLWVKASEDRPTHPHRCRGRHHPHRGRRAALHVVPHGQRRHHGHVILSQSVEPRNYPLGPESITD